MKVGLLCLALAYVLSQFYRVFLAVLTPTLIKDLGITPGDLAISSGLWFTAFALMQFPVGWALDHIGPRRTASVLMGLGGAGGALVFALAQGPMALHLSMVLIGMGCSPTLMASYYIFARIYSPKVFGTLAGATVGVGSLGNILGAAPLAWLIGAVGWRETLVCLAGLTLLVSVLIYLLVRDPDRLGGQRSLEGSLLDVIGIRALWPIMALMLVAYAPAAVIRGLWAGPFFSDVYGADTSAIGTATLVMGLAMVVGNFALGPLDRITGSRKWGVVAGVFLSVLCLGALVLWPGVGQWSAIWLLAGHGMFGATFGGIMSHGRSFLPPHLIGRGVSFINMFAIGGAGILQFASRPVYRIASEAGDPAHTFRMVFLTFLAPLCIGLVIYLFSRDNRV
ncbi:MAG: MFS transporter [Paracoccaceae bacterium]